MRTAFRIKEWWAIETVAFAALVLSLLAGRRRDDRPVSRPAPPPRSERIAVALAVALAAGTLAHDLRAARYQPHGAELYDDVSYHLPAAVLWQQSGDLRMLRFDYGDRSTSFYPILGELADWMLLAGFEGSDFLARWSQLPAAVGILFAVWALARRLGASPWGAPVALLLSLTVPRIFPELALSAGKDLWAASKSEALNGIHARRETSGCAPASRFRSTLLRATARPPMPTGGAISRSREDLPWSAPPFKRFGCGQSAGRNGEPEPQA